jgi:hypothetical protein
MKALVAGGLGYFGSLLVKVGVLDINDAAVSEDHGGGMNDALIYRYI